MGATIVQDLGNRLKKAVSKRKDEVSRLKNEKGIDLKETDLPLDLSPGVRRRLKKLVNFQAPKPTDKQIQRYIRNKLKRKGYKKIHFKDGVPYTAELNGETLTKEQIELVLKEIGDENTNRYNQ